MTVRRPPSDQRGFALALVVLLLFAIGVLGATGYQIAVVSSGLALQGKEGQRALAIARAGIQRYVTEQRGVPADTVAYPIDGGDAVVTARRVAQSSDTISLYLIQSEGVYMDPASTSAEARKTVYQYAEHREVPLDFEAALIMASGALIVESNGEIEGRDQANNNACTQNSVDIAGAMMGSGALTFGGGDVTGSPDSITIGSYQAVLDSIGLAWDVFDHPNFVADYEDRWPPGNVPADSFLVIRFTGNRTARWGQSGRGVLIVQGEFTPRNGFNWEGIILAGAITPRTSGGGWTQSYRLEGVVVSGLGDTGTALTVTRFGNIEYNRCHAYDAARSIAYFRPVGDAWWEGV